ncbi:MAG: hypothetical protein AAB966_01595, partial [Patescibacteria group bacterium]
MREVVKLPTVYTATSLRKLTVVEILAMDWAGRKTTLPAGISEHEKVKIQEAADKSKGRIQIIETDPAAEKNLMRRIDTDFLNSKNKKEIFMEYLEKIKEKDALLKEEYVEHVLKHNAKEDNILNFHTMNNLGFDLLKDDAPGNGDELRTRMFDFVDEIIEETG